MRILSSAASLSLLAVAVACGGGGGSGDGEVADLRAPLTVTQVPAPGDTNVWARDPITLTFSRPIAPPADDAVVLALDGGRVIPAMARLSSDRKTLTIEPDALPPPRSEVTVVFRNPILERPGKAVEIPDWTFTVPQWQLLAPPLDLYGDFFWNVELAAAPDGNVFLTRQSSIDGIFTFGDVLQSGPEAWTEIGAPEIPPEKRIVVGLPVIVDGTGAPVTAWRHSDGVLDVERYADSGWRPLGSLPSAGSWDPRSVRLTLDSAGRPVIAWADVVEGTPKILLARWNGTAWESLMQMVAVGRRAFDLASGPDGKVGVALTDGSQLVLAEPGDTLGEVSTPSGCNEVSATFDPDGLVAACTDSAGMIRVFRTARDAMGIPRLFEVGASPSSAGHHVALRYRPTGAPDARLVLAFLEATGPRVLGWNGQSWVSISQEIATPGLPLYQDSDTASRSLAVSARGELVYGWAEVVGRYTFAYYVARYND